MQPETAGVRSVRLLRFCRANHRISIVDDRCDATGQHLRESDPTGIRGADQLRL